MLAIGWPAATLVARCVADGAAPQDGFGFSSRQLGLLWRTVWMAGTAAMSAVLISLPAAAVIGGSPRSGLLRAMPAALLAVLLCPSMVYAFAWGKILPVAFDAYARCVGVWTLWAWPIPAVLIGTGWRRCGRGAYESALLETSRVRALVYTALPAMRGYVAVTVFVLFVLLLGDYGVPHACGLSVFATELLARAEESSRVIDVAWPAILPAGVTLAALIVLRMLWRRHIDLAPDDSRRHSGTCPAGLKVAAAVLFAVAWLLPIGVLMGRLGSFAPIKEAHRVYGFDLAWSLGAAATAGVLVTGAGLGLQSVRAIRAIGLQVAIIFGALPGALIGLSLVAAYNRDATGWLYDHWPIVALAYVSRFAWVGLIAGVLVTRHTSRDLLDQARTDGADATRLWVHVMLPMHAPWLLAAVATVTALAVGDVAASSLVRVPDFNPIAHVIVEKFHRMEDGMLISLSLWLVAAGLPAIGLLLLTRPRLRNA